MATKVVLGLSACVEQLSHIQSIGNSTEEVIFLQAANT
jgi:hypothetical protein